MPRTPGGAQFSEGDLLRAGEGGEGGRACNCITVSGAVWNFRLQCRFACRRDAIPRAPVGIHLLLDPALRYHSVKSHLAGRIQLSR
jgi:hypothetical protein